MDNAKHGQLRRYLYRLLSNFILYRPPLSIPWWILGDPGSEGPGNISGVSDRNHEMETLSTNDYPYRISRRIIWKQV